MKRICFTNLELEVLLEVAGNLDQSMDNFEEGSEDAKREIAALYSAMEKLRQMLARRSKRR